MQYKNSIFCDRPFMHTHILCDGEVICHCLPELWFDENGKRIMSMGFLKDFDSFEDLWNGKNYKELRNNFINQEGRYLETCSKCPLKYNINLYKNSFDNPSEIFSSLNNLRSPKYVQLELTTKCVYKCSECHRTRSPETVLKRLDMSEDIFEKFLNGLTDDTKTVVTYGQGESLAHPKFFDFVRRIREKLPNVFITSCTNMWYVDSEEKAKKFLECGINRIEMAIYGTNDEEFYEYYKLRCWEKVKKNMEILCSLRSKMQVGPEVLWKYILFKWCDSDSSLDFLYKKSKELGVKVELTTTITPPDGYSKRYMQDTKAYIDLVKKFDARELRAYSQSELKKEIIIQNKSK